MSTTNIKIIILTLAMGASLVEIHAQDNNARPAAADRGRRIPGGAGGPEGDGGPGGPGGAGGPGGMRLPPNPVIEALDLNHDGVIDAGELAKATESLKKLDKNGDGKLTPDEFRPTRPGGRGGPGAPGGEEGGPGQGRRVGPGGPGAPGSQGGQPNSQRRPQ